ncbi:hypothetical protein N7468_000217 [Penicillium chermesinum]|uniref:Uncharacterized protein n=1 Tax=Penicillium chermesinum TaxID=63820 RepID=A0A9W9U090_9EURO|nr:uncharacterized protein N7468_000217 [Penicillium chermesinum]KAJ5248766.1 hypothetical protein N7468_000217 [Penicillium chermesinum]
MSDDTETNGATAQPSVEEDFVVLEGGLDDFEEASDDEADEDASLEGSFHPQHITLEVFLKLLSCYATTLEQVHRRKAMLKLQPKPEKGSKSRAIKRAGSASANLRGALLIQKTEFNASETAHIKSEVEKMQKLDTWRYEEMPKIMDERRSKQDAVIMDKDDLIKVMDWKTRHGLPRPTLMGMVKSNQPKTIIKCAKDAINGLPTVGPEDSSAFPKPSMDALQPLRGRRAPVSSDPILQRRHLSLALPPRLSQHIPDGTQNSISTTATAVSTEHSKKLAKYKRPNGELNVKYNIAEYKQLWNASWDLRQRLNREAGDESVSHNDIEKVAYVLRNIAVSGFYPGVDPTEILQAHASKQELADKAVQAERDAENAMMEKMMSKKRKREEKEKGEKSGGRNKKKKN